MSIHNVQNHQYTRREAISAALVASMSLALLSCKKKRSPEELQQTDLPSIPFETPMTVDRNQAFSPNLSPLSFTWKLIASGLEGPGPRSRHCFAYDQNAKVTVLFSGVIGSGRDWRLNADTWELQDGQWSKIRTQTSPTARHRGAMVYHPPSQQTILFGGQAEDQKILGDTWSYSKGVWRNLKRTTQPQPRCGHSLAFDSKTGKIVLFGGIDRNGNSLKDTWLFDGSSWSAVSGLSPAQRRYAAFAYDPELAGCVLHGGSVDDAGELQFGDTWLFAQNTWNQLSNSLFTNSRDDHALAYHSVAKSLVMLDGLSRQRGVLVKQKDRWLQAQVDPLHPQHQCSPLVWDEQCDGLVLHGGETQAFGPLLDMTLVLKLDQA